MSTPSLPKVSDLDTYFLSAITAILRAHTADWTQSAEGVRWAREMVQWLILLVLDNHRPPPQPIQKADWTEAEHDLLASVQAVAMAWHSRAAPKGGDFHLASFVLETFTYYWTWAYRSGDYAELCDRHNRFKDTWNP